MTVRIFVSIQMTPEEWKEYDRTHPNPSKAEIDKLIKWAERKAEKREEGKNAKLS